jgi:hypothetical protein
MGGTNMNFSRKGLKQAKKQKVIFYLNKFGYSACNFGTIMEIVSVLLTKKYFLWTT